MSRNQHSDPASSSRHTASLKEPKSCLISNGRRQITSRFDDDSEMVEEFDVITDELLVRKTRRPTAVGGEGMWSYEVGAPPPRAFNADFEVIRESSDMPMVSRNDTPEAHVFRVRNLPYPKDVFDVQVSTSKTPLGDIVVRTSNKKFYKVLEIPEMKRANLALDGKNLSIDVQHNTLIITYQKHLGMKVAEAAAKQERAKMEATRVKGDDQQQCAHQ